MTSKRAGKNEDRKENERPKCMSPVKIRRPEKVNKVKKIRKITINAVREDEQNEESSGK